jgi:hypothetical protein
MRNPHEIGTDRRGFIKQAGLVLLAVELLPSIARASEGSPGAGGDPAEALVIRSGPGFVPHTHDLWIPHAILRAPPGEGVKLISAMARGHTHEVALSHDDLAAVNQGGTVSVKGGSHTFVIAIAQAVSDPTPASQTQRSGA